MTETARQWPHTDTHRSPRPAQLYATRSEPESDSPAVVEHSGEGAMIWRALTAQLYAALGSPALPGYSPRKVRDILSGHHPLDSQFVGAMLAACRAALGVLENTPNATTGRSRHGSRLLRRLTRRATPHADEAAQLARTLRQIETMHASQPASKRSETGSTDVAIGYTGRRRIAAPFPEDATTAAEFAAGMRAVKQWSGLSFRQLEQQARQHGTWLPRSSICDMLRRDSIPRPEALNTLMCAFGLPPGERERWLALREKVAAGMPTAMAGSRSEGAEA